IDIDPKRPRAVAATQEQLLAAREFASFCEKMLHDEYAWPDPVVAGSGNGYYLLYRINLPNDDHAKQLISTVLRRIDARMREIWADRQPQVHVDVGVHNAARMIRLIGTTNRKGTPTADQPHRRSRFGSVPDPLVTLTLELLQGVVGGVSTPM